MATPYRSRSAVYGFRTFAPATSHLTFRADTKQFISLLNRMTGRFQGGPFRHAVTDVNEAAAKFVQQGMAERLKDRIRETGRPQRGDHRLEISILAEDNREATVSGFRVGRQSWLDRSPAALYWRRIEEGDQTTFDAYVLFTTGGRTYGPFTPGGGNRREPPLRYPHLRMIQNVGVFVRGIGPYPAYRYSEGGLANFQKYDIAGRYQRALSAAGIPTEVFAKK